nr:MFS transporter [Micromonospora tulbaghiae]
MLQSLITPVLPTIQHDLHTSPNTVTWVLTAYLLSASVFTPIVGRIGDMVGKEKTLVFSLAALALGCLLAALAPSIGVLIAARVVQGIGGAVFPLSFGIIRDEFPAARVSSAVASISAVVAVGGGLGVVLAGPIVATLGYRWLFWIPLVVVGLTALAAHRFVPRSPVRTPGRINWLSAVLLSGWLVAQPAVLRQRLGPLLVRLLGLVQRPGRGRFRRRVGGDRDDEQRVVAAGLVAHLVDEPDQRVPDVVRPRAVEHQHRIGGAAPVPGPPEPPPVRQAQVLQERVQQQLLHLGRVFAVAPAGGEPLGEAEERHRLPGRQVLLAHEPAVLPSDERHPAGDGDSEHDAGHGPPQQPEQQVQRGAEAGVAADLGIVTGPPSPPVPQPADQRGPAAVGGVQVHGERLVHQPVGQRVVPEPQPGRAERLHGQLPVQFAQHGRDVVAGRPAGQVQHGVRYPPPGPARRETP